MDAVNITIRVHLGEATNPFRRPLQQSALLRYDFISHDIAHFLPAYETRPGQYLRARQTPAVMLQIK